MRVAAVLLVGFFSLSSSIGLTVGFDCETAIEGLTVDPKSTDQMIQDLAALRLQLDLAKLEGESSVAFTALKANFETKERLLVNYLEKNKIMTREQFLGRLKVEIAGLQKQSDADRGNDKRLKDEESLLKEEQAKQIRNFVIDGTQAIFHKVEGGEFMMGGATGKAVPVTLTALPEIMATSMTQIIYKKIAELANARFPQDYQIEADPSEFKGDTRPVERVSYEDVVMWTKALNDLSDAGEPSLQLLIPGHKQGMHYNGFMSEAQREYLMKKVKTEDGDSIDDMYKRGDVSKIRKYVVFGRQPSDGTATVDSGAPLFIDGKPFSGLQGNVFEWVADSWNSKTDLVGGIDPIATFPGPGRGTRGGSWANTEITSVFSSVRFGREMHSRHNNLGFRLVRVVK